MNQEHPTNGYSSLPAEEETLNLREIVETYLIYWKWILASAVLFLLVGGVYLLTQRPMYEFRASVLVMDPRSQMNEMAILSELRQMGITTARNATNNEERVLRSTHLMRRVVDALELHTTYAYRVQLHREDLYTSSPYRVVLDSASLQRLSKPLLMEIDFQGSEYQVSGSFDGEEFSHRVSSLPALLSTPAGRVRIEERLLGDASVKLKDGKDLRGERIYVTIQNPSQVAQRMAADGIQTEIDKLADEIWITYRSNNVARGRDVLNHLVRLYNRDAVEQITQSAIFSSIFIDGRLALLERELAEEEQRIENYKQENQLTNIEADTELFLQNNSKYFNLQVENEIQLQLVSYLKQYINTPSNRLKMIPDPGLRDMSMSGVIDEYNKLIALKERVSLGGSSNNPTLITLTQQAESMHASILGGMNNLHSALSIRNRELEDQNRLFRSRLSAIPRQEREFVEIKRQQQVKEALYVFLLQKREETSLSKAVATQKARLLNAPDAARQVAPRRVIIMGVFLMLGIFFPVAFIFLRNLLNTSIHSRSDVEKLTTLPILSELAHNKSPEPLFDHTSSALPNGELFRLLRAKLQFVLHSPKEKVVLVTSTQPAEGKSFVCMNLAISLSMMDKKVLLVGLDLRKPTVAKMLGLDVKDGITAYLSGQVDDVRKLILPLADFPNLEVLPAGVVPPNPNELIVKQKFDKLFEELRPQYDYILLDTSPVGAVSDTYLIDRVADLCLYICRSEFSDKRNIEFVNRLDREGTLKRIFLVINDVDFESNKYTYYRKYGYGYGYGYGLGQRRK